MFTNYALNRISLLIKDLGEKKVEVDWFDYKTCPVALIIKYLLNNEDEFNKLLYITEIKCNGVWSYFFLKYQFLENEEKDILLKLKREGLDCNDFCVIEDKTNIDFNNTFVSYLKYVREYNTIYVGYSEILN